ncbi:MAG: hypothetical protein LBR27_01230 [Bifidobacteriaceae bacterium]|nr:hypothetical protein [Bifidobacteriaceae bacterium]
MTIVLAVADDLTGANATAGALATLGFTAVTLPVGRASQGATHLPADAVVISTNSRNLPKEQAVDLLEQAIAGLPLDTCLVAKRIDTTLRGNLAAETLALLQGVRRQRPESRVAGLVVAAYPASGRTTEGGRQLLHGLPVSQTAAAQDPLNPVTESRISRLFEHTGQATATEINLELVRGPQPTLAAALEHAARSADIVVVDAAADGDLTAIAQAANLVAGGLPHAPETPRAPIAWLPIDPGPFTAELAALSLTSATPPGQVVLVLAGSTSRQTQEQLDALRTRRAAAIGHLDLTELDQSDPAQTEAILAAATDSLARAAAEGAAIVGVQATPPSPTDRDQGAQATQAAATLGRLALAATQAIHPVGLYASGGDTAAAVIQALGATGLKIQRQVLPLAMLATLEGGPHHGLPIVTKGGLVGTATAALACVAALTPQPDNPRFPKRRH